MFQCSNPTCTINKGKCDKQHRCFTCGSFTHRMCLFDITVKETGDYWDDLAFPGNCVGCDKNPKNRVLKAAVLKNKDKKDFDEKGLENGKDKSAKEKDSPIFSPRRTRSKKKKIDLKSDEKEKKKIGLKDPDPADGLTKNEDDAGVTLINGADLFLESEKFLLLPGFMTFSNLKRGERLLDQYNEIPEGFTSRSQIVDKLVNIPATYWGKIDTESRDVSKMWWKTEIYNKALNDLTPDEMVRTILYGKVLQKAPRSQCYEVVLMNALNEICLIHSGTIRNFLYNDGGGGKKKATDKAKDKKKKGKNGKKTRISTVHEADEESSDNDSNSEKEYDEDELIEVNSGMSSEDDMQEDDGSSSDSDTESEAESDDEEEDKDFVRIEPRTKIKRKWEVVENHTETSFNRPKMESYVNCVPIGGWTNLSPSDVFFMQLPKNELDIWCTETSKNLLKEKKKAIDVDEMKVFIGCLFAITQGRKVGGITKCFESITDGLFPPLDLGRFGMKLRQFQSIMSCLEYADKSKADENDTYWRTEQLFHCFNDHYATIVTYGTYVNVDERIFWSYARAQPEGIKVCGRKPKGTGQECKTLSCIDMNVTTTFEHVRGNSNNEYIRDHMKEYGKAASVVI